MTLLKDSQLCSKWIYTELFFFSLFTGALLSPIFSSPWFACCHPLCKLNHVKRHGSSSFLILPVPTFATLWPLPSLPAFGPGLDFITTWYRLILRKEDQYLDLLLTAVNSEVAFACLLWLQWSILTVNIPS